MSMTSSAEGKTACDKQEPAPPEETAESAESEVAES